jgi:hypothetical protein
LEEHFLQYLSQAHLGFQTSFGMRAGDFQALIGLMIVV